MVKLYSEKDRHAAAANLRNSLLLYIATTVLFIAACVAFVLLYVHIDTTLALWLCLIVDCLLTICLFWMTVLYFADVFPRKRAAFRLFKIMENANTHRVSAVFCSTRCNKTVELTEYTECVFDNNGEELLYYVLPGTEQVFDPGADYILEVMGERITAYEKNAVTEAADE